MEQKKAVCPLHPVSAISVPIRMGRKNQGPDKPEFSFFRHHVAKREQTPHGCSVGVKSWFQQGAAQMLTLCVQICHKDRHTVDGFIREGAVRRDPLTVKFDL